MACVGAMKLTKGFVVSTVKVLLTPKAEFPKVSFVKPLHTYFPSGILLTVKFV